MEFHLMNNTENCPLFLGNTLHLISFKNLNCFIFGDRQSQWKLVLHYISIKKSSTKYMDIVSSYIQEPPIHFSQYTWRSSRQWCKLSTPKPWRRTGDKLMGRKSAWHDYIQRCSHKCAEMNTGHQTSTCPSLENSIQSGTVRQWVFLGKKAPLRRCKMIR